MLSTKNAMLSQSAQDLGLGDQLKGQLEADLINRKKKLLQASGLGMQANPMGQAATALGLGMAGGTSGGY